MSSELFRIVDTLSLDSDTVALSARQGKILNEKILNLSLFSISDGLVPIGAVIAVSGVFSGPNNTGIFKTAPSANNNISSSGMISQNGFQLCDGAKVNVNANTSFVNNYVPNLTDDRFLKGSSTSGVVSGVNGANKGDNTISLTVAQLPTHTHTITTNSVSTLPQQTLTVTGTTSTDGWHNHYAYTTSGGEHEHWSYRVDSAIAEVEGAWQGGRWVTLTDRAHQMTWGGGSHGHNIGVDGAGNHSHTVTSTGTFAAHSHTVSSSASNTGDGVSFDIQPKFLTCNYYIRVR
jgi:hypothetical protein